MLRWWIRRQLDAFEKEYGYDASYAREILEADLDAMFRLSRVMGIGQYRKGVPVEAWYAAKLATSVKEDCGPCTQLLAEMAAREGVAPDVIRAILEGDVTDMPDGVELSYRFAQGVLGHEPFADELRERVVQRWGRLGLISLGYAITAARLFPTLKYALGHGQACSRVEVGGTPVRVKSVG